MTADEVVRRLHGKWYGDQALVRCPVEGHGKGRGDLWPSLSIAVGSNGRVLLHCFAGCRAEDVFAAVRSAGRAEAGAQRRDLGHAPRSRYTRGAAQAMWNAARPVKGTAGESYLRSRGLETESDALGFLRQARHPTAHGAGLVALLAAVHGPDGVLSAVQRTFLTHEGARAAVDPGRMMLGRLGCGAVRLAPATCTLGLAEGVETALAASQMHGIPCWAACGARLDRVALPASVRHVVLFADNDPPGLATAHRATVRLGAEGRSVEVRVPQLENGDWNDVLLAARTRPS
jgi:putative DNA primase/helicase